MLINMMSKMNLMRRCAMALLLLLPAFAHAQAPAGEAEAELLFREVRVLTPHAGRWVRRPMCWSVATASPRSVTVRGPRPRPG